MFPNNPWIWYYGWNRSCWSWASFSHPFWIIKWTLQPLTTNGAHSHGIMKHDHDHGHGHSAHHGHNHPKVVDHNELRQIDPRLPDILKSHHNDHDHEEGEAEPEYNHDHDHDEHDHDQHDHDH